MSPNFFRDNHTILSIINRRVVGQNVGQRQKRRWGKPSAVTVSLTHIGKAKWVSRQNRRTINAEKPPFLAFFLVFWSEMGDSNSRHPAPKAGALPTALHPGIKLFYPAGRILPNQARYQTSLNPEPDYYSPNSHKKQGRKCFTPARLFAIIMS